MNAYWSAEPSDALHFGEYGPGSVVIVPVVGARLTDDEHAALSLTAQLSRAFGKIVGGGESRQGDLHEATIHIHALQRMLMAQAAARAYPELYRLMGGDAPCSNSMWPQL